MRIFPVKYGFYLNEFDPYYNYRAVSYIVENIQANGIQGLLSYFSWIDTHTWYPEGRQVASSSQTGLHLTGAALYLLFTSVFGSTIELYDFLVLLPVLLGALTTIVIFLLVRVVAGSKAGLFSALIIAYAPAIIARGNLGWFKSEPLALLLTLFASYLFLKIFNNTHNDNNYKNTR